MLDGRLGRNGKAGQFARTPEGIEALGNFCRANGVTLVVMEATGGYEKLPFGLLWQQGIPVAILMPEECPDLVCQDIAAFAKLRSTLFFAQRHPPGTPDKIGCDIALDEPLLTSLVHHFT